MYDPATKKLTYANGGHCPPMLIRDGNCIRLDALTPIGMFLELAATERTVQILPGDWLLAFTDGIPEAANEDGVEFGDEGLLLSFGRLSSSRAKEVCEVLIAGVKNHLREQRQPDDITLIAMKALS